eukprot:TRINITY_DN1392_c0_g1_i3.p1 TRINITY_DN1392_c0_g1~~TRINITY_DN1392_c0_g1_i3.p1  ORF type:complete len:390 (-),score=57.88 TRINITY_DN1392_c0_g1_i3:839-2008(-)
MCIRDRVSTQSTGGPWPGKMHGLPKRQHRAMSRYVLLVVACGIASAAPVTQDLTSTTSNTTITVYGHGSTLREHTKVANTLDSAQGTAWGTFVDGAVTPSNFGSLSLQSSPNASDVDQMYAIGFAEGYLTQHRIYQEVLNLREPVLVHYGKLPSTDPKDFPPLTQFLNDNDQYVREMVASNINDPFWRALGLVLAQFDGLMAGYAQAAPATEALSLFDFQMLNGVGDLFDLIPAVIPKLRRDFASMPAPELKQYTFEAGRCSGLIKVLGDYSDLFFSHASWWSYYAMIRMMKHYHTPLRVCTCPTNCLYAAAVVVRRVSCATLCAHAVLTFLDVRIQPLPPTRFRSRLTRDSSSRSMISTSWTAAWPWCRQPTAYSTRHYTTRSPTKAC